MFYNLIKCSDYLEKIIYFGSGAEFDKRYPIIRVREEEFGVRKPITPYGISKYTKNEIARGSKKIYNLRSFGLFGKYEDWRIYFISNLCCKAIFGLPLTIRQECTFDYLYIRDMCKIVEWFLENSPQYHDYNVCSGKPILLSDIAKLVRAISGKELPIIIESKGMNLEYTGDNNRLLKEMHDFRLMPLKESIQELYEWYMHNQNLIDYDTLKISK